MKNLKQLLGLSVLLIFFSSCSKEKLTEAELLELKVENVEFTSTNSNTSGFIHGIVVEIDGEEFYFDGAPDGPEGALDVPGHDWIMAGKSKLVGKHYNTGPFGAPKWWSSDAEDGAFLYKVDAQIDEWTPEKAEEYADKGYVHYHELVSVEDGSFHTDKVVWLKHIARTSFTLDGGPMPEMAHEVTPGIDWEFMPNWFMPYDPEEGNDH